MKFSVNKLFKQYNLNHKFIVGILKMTTYQNFHNVRENEEMRKLVSKPALKTGWRTATNHHKKKNIYVSHN